MIKFSEEVGKMNDNKEQPIFCTACGAPLGNINPNVMTVQCFCLEIMTVSVTPSGVLDVRSTANAS